MYKTENTRPILDMGVAHQGEYFAAADGSLFLIDCLNKYVNRGWAATTLDISDDGKYITVY